MWYMHLKFCDYGNKQLKNEMEQDPDLLVQYTDPYKNLTYPAH